MKHLEDKFICSCDNSLWSRLPVTKSDKLSDYPAEMGCQIPLNGPVSDCDLCDLHVFSNCALHMTTCSQPIFTSCNLCTRLLCSDHMNTCYCNNFLCTPLPSPTSTLSTSLAPTTVPKTTSSSVNLIDPFLHSMSSTTAPKPVIPLSYSFTPRLSYQERWDLSIVRNLLEKPQDLSTCDHRVLTDVLKSADKNGYLTIDYAYGKGSDFGRLFSKEKRGYQGCTTKIRTLCSSRFYVEDDMVNSFPTIMHQLFNRLGLCTPFLTTYVNERELLFL